MHASTVHTKATLIIIFLDHSEAVNSFILPKAPSQELLSTEAVDSRLSIGKKCLASRSLHQDAGDIVIINYICDNELQAIFAAESEEV